MYFEVPDCRRCCLCVPLRHGVLIFGYLKLFFSIFTLALDISIEMKYSYGYHSSHVMILYRGVAMFVQLWLAYLFYVLELLFNVLLIVGAHRKSTRLMRIYYYYGIVTTLASFLVFLVVRTHERSQLYPDPLEICLAFSGLVLQCYLLLLIRAELNKLQYLAGPFRYVNHVAEITVDMPSGGARENAVL